MLDTINVTNASGTKCAEVVPTRYAAYDNGCADLSNKKATVGSVWRARSPNRAAAAVRKLTPNIEPNLVEYASSLTESVTLWHDVG